MIPVLPAIAVSPRPVAPRFWGRVERAGDDDCWPFRGAVNRWGYGLIGVSGTSFIASRVAYTLATGTDPGESLVLHTCDNPPCCNPAHLWLGTNQHNTDDKMAKGRARNGPTPGERNGQAKLTAAQVLEIARSHLSNLALAELFNVSDGTIRLIRNGQRWSSVTGIAA